MNELNIRTRQIPIDWATYRCGGCGHSVTLTRDGADEIAEPAPCVCGITDYWEVTDLRATTPDGQILAMPPSMSRPWWVDVPVLIERPW